MGETTIAWATHSWNISDGCTEADGDPACAQCYARQIAARFGARENHPFHGVAKMVHGYSRWTGIVRPRPSALQEPAKWKEPRRVFVDSMADVFHEKLPFLYLDEVFEVMQAHPQHTFMLLTKRPERMAAYSLRLRDNNIMWPRNVWAGTSIGTQKFVVPRIESLVQVRSYVRFLSLEPLLEPLLLAPAVALNPSKIHMAIIGGESGPSARPCKLEWIRDLVVQCRVHGIAPFVKQLGTRLAKERGCKDYKGEDPKEWPMDLWVREYPAIA